MSGSGFMFHKLQIHASNTSKQWTYAVTQNTKGFKGSRYSGKKLIKNR